MKFSVAKKMLVTLVAWSCPMFKRFTRYVVRFAATPNEAAFSNVSFAAHQKRAVYTFLKIDPCKDDGKRHCCKAVIN